MSDFTPKSDMCEDSRKRYTDRVVDLVADMAPQSDSYHPTSIDSFLPMPPVVMLDFAAEPPNDPCRDQPETWY